MKGIELQKVKNSKEIIFSGKSFLTDEYPVIVVAKKTAEFQEQDGSTWFSIYEYVPKMHLLVDVSVFEAAELVAWFKQNAISEHYLTISDDMRWGFDLTDDKEIRRVYTEYKKYMLASTEYNNVITKDEYHVRCIQSLPEVSMEEIEEQDDVVSAAESLAKARDNAMPRYWKKISDAVRTGNQSIDILFMKEFYPSKEELAEFTRAGYNVLIKKYREQYTTIVSWTNAKEGVEGSLKLEGFDEE